jgi:hypothetical protein
MQVADLDIDLHQFKFYFNHDKTDIQVLTEFIDSHSYFLHIRRLDANTGWDDDIQVLACYLRENQKKSIQIGSSPSPNKTIAVDETEFEIMPSNIPVDFLKSYCLQEPQNINKLERHLFNERFGTQIVVLPDTVFAVGYENDEILLYNEKFNMYFEIIHSIKYIISIVKSFTSYSKIVFLIEARDGFMENCFFSENRTVPKIIEEYECQNDQYPSLSEYEYPVFDKTRNIYMLGQSTHKNMPYTIPIADRHFFYCNLYNPFRSFHQGNPFHSKINKIVFAGRLHNSNKYNFTKRRDIEISQRHYFYSDAVPKDNIYCSADKWIDSSEMRNYKYILDMDGKGSTWDATAWKLNSNSVIFKTDSRWRQWFYDEYIAWKHYVPIADDFSDLQEKYQWCETHQDECEIIIRNAKQLFQKIYRMNSVINYHTKMINTIAESFTDKNDDKIV